MDHIHADSDIGKAIFGEGEIVEVAVSGCTFGPHTRDFGLRYVILIRDGRGPGQDEYVGTFSVGRGGNNSRPLGVFQTRLTEGFSTKSVFQQVMKLENAARRARIDLSYHKRPQVLQPEDVDCSFYFTKSERQRRSLFFRNRCASN